MGQGIAPHPIGILSLKLLQIGFAHRHTHSFVLISYFIFDALHFHLVIN